MEADDNLTIQDKPVQDFEKIQTILYELKSGKDRSTIAKTLGYSNPKSLDIYMRRKGFTYDKKNNNYVPLTTDEISSSRTFSKDKRITTILSMFSKDNPDPRRIAEITGFNNHIELAEFMKSNNFAWDDGTSNYIRLKAPDPEDGANPSIDASELYIYLPMLQKLYEHREKLYALLEAPAADLGSSNRPLKLTLPDDLTALLHKFLQNTK